MLGMIPPNPAYMKWIQSIPNNLDDADLVAWMKANPPPPKTPPPVSQAIADFIAEEVKKQVAAALTQK